MYNNGYLRIKRDKLMLYFIMFTTTLFGMLINNPYFLTWICVIQLIVAIFNVRHSGYNIFSFPVLFVFFSFVFHVFRLFYYYLTGDESLMTVFWYRDSKSISDAVHFYLLTMFFLTSGVLLSNKRGYQPIKKYNIEDMNICLGGIILFVIGIIPKLMINYEQFIIGQTKGYLEVYEVDLTGRGTLATLVYPGIFMILIANRTKKNLCNVIILVTGLYEMIIMLSGNRFASLSFLLTIMLVYITYINKISIKKTFFYVVIFVLVVAFLNTIRENRLDGIGQMNFWELYLEQLKENPIVSLGCELGGTLNTLILSIKHFPKVCPYAYGMSYLMFIPNLIPKINIHMSYDFLTFINNFPRRDALGGDFMGELYFNFSYFGSIFGIIIGYFVAKIQRIFEQYDNNNISAVICTPIICYSFYYIRGYFSAYRIAIYHIIIISILVNILSRINIGRLKK